MSEMSSSVESHPVIRDATDFDVRSGNLLERLLFNYRLAVVIICVLITGLLGFQATNLTLNAAFEKMIPTKHQYISNYLSHKKELSGLGNTLRITVETKGDTIFDRDYLEVVRQLNDELFLVKGVERPYMKSIWTSATRWIGVTEEGFDGGPVMHDEYDGSQESLDQVRRNVERSGEVGQLIAANYLSSVILLPLIDLDPETGVPIDYQVFSDRLEELRSKYESDTIKIHITGFAKVVGDLIAGLKQVVLFFGATIVICAAVLFGYTRCLRSTLLVVTSSLVAVAWLLGVLPLLGYELDPYSILVPFLVFAVGMSHGAQMMNGIMQEIGHGTHKLVAARYTFRRLFFTGVTALMTDAIGFAVLMVIAIKVIQDLALVASLGVLVLIFTNLILLPVLFSWFGVSKTAALRSYESQISDKSDPEHRSHPLWAFLDKFTTPGRAHMAVLLAAIIGAVGLVVSLEVKIGDLDPGAPELWPDSRYNLDNAFVVENYAASSDVYVIMVEVEEYACGQYENLIQLDALEWRLQQLPSVVSTNSLAAQSKLSSAGMNEGSLKWYEIPLNQNQLNAIVTRAPRALFNQNCDLLTVYAFLTDHKADTLTRVVNVVEEFAEEHNAESIKFLSAAGSAGIEAATNIVVERANLQMLLLVYSAVIIISFITFRSVAAVLCAIVPLMLTSILCQALMVVLGIGVKVATLPVIALGVGVGVDYALYVMSVVLLCKSEGATLGDAYYKALLSTGKMVILTGITLGISVCTWAFSPIKFQADMGILLGFMFIWNMLGALILLPALAYFLIGDKDIVANKKSTGKPRVSGKSR